MISVSFQTESHFPVNRRKIRAAVIDALKGKVLRDTELGVAVVGDRRMRQLNTTYRHLDETTDVLSFPLNDPTTKAPPFVDFPNHALHLGDIVVSYPQAVTQATQENRLVDEVVIELVLHGLNHLLGIHHKE